MKILIIPTIREIYINQFESCVDIKLLNFIRSIFKTCVIEIYSNRLKNDYDLIIISGGNNSITKNNADKVRNKINNLIYRFAIKKKIKIIGICHGAHFLSKKSGFILEKKNNHIGKHKVNFNINKNSFKKIVNSFHRETIKFKKNSFINIFGIAEDNTVEAFHVKKHNILGIMWHPERYKRVNNFDRVLIKNFYATNSIVCR